MVAWQRSTPRMAAVACATSCLREAMAIGLKPASRYATSAYAVVVPPASLSPQRLESGWLVPALARLARGDLQALHLIADGNGGAGTWSAARPTWWRRIAARAAHRRFDVPRAA